MRRTSKTVVLPAADVPAGSEADRQADHVLTRVPRDVSRGVSQLIASELGDGPGLLDRLEPPEPAREPRRRYEVEREVARGGMGKVLAVRDTDLNRRVAMKVLLPDEGGHSARFIEEAQITGQLEHPGVLPVHELGVNAAGELFFTMQYVRGHRTLRQELEALRAGDPRAHGELTFERRVQIMQQVCHALGYAHGRGVIHRDVKPENIVLGAHGEVYLVDWGVAKLVGAPVDAAAEDEGARHEAAGGEAPEPVTAGDEAIRVTRRGSIVGTPAYMSPEQAMGDTQRHGPASDVYGACAVLYELLSLHHYLDGVVPARPRVLELLQAIARARPRDAEDWVQPLSGRPPRALSRICRRGLAKRPEDRFASARELEHALQAWLEGKAPIVCPGTFIQRAIGRLSRAIDRHPTAVPAFVVTLAIVLAALAAAGVVAVARLVSD